MVEPTHSFGYWLKRYRRALDLTQEQLASSVACSHFAIRKIEADERRPSKALAERLTTRLGIAPEDREHFMAAARGLGGVDRLALQSRPIATGAAANIHSEASHPIPSEPATRPAGPVVPEFVGRAAEMAALDSAADQARAGSGQVRLLAGQPGIGKTRMAQAIADRAAAQGMVVLWGRCPEEDGAPPYWPWVQLVRAYAERLDAESMRRMLGIGARCIAEIGPELLPIVPGSGESNATTDAAQARFLLFDAMASFWKRAASAEGLVLLLDDLHWADASSLRLLEFVAADIAGSRLLIVGTYRDGEVDRRHPLSNTLGQLARSRGFGQLALAGLTLDETRALVAPRGDHDEAALARIHAQTEGNPLYLSEMARFLALPESATRTARRLPAGVRAAIGTRLNRLSPDCNRVLANAAVIGRAFELPVLVRMADTTSEEDCVAAIEEALDANVIEELPETDAYRFGHALIREILYDEISGIRRPRLHHRVAMAIEEVYRHALTGQLSRLAFHYSASMPSQGAEKALDFCRRAGESAMALFAYEEAAREFGTALEARSILERCAPQDLVLRCELMIRQGEAQVCAASYATARDTLRAAADLAMANDLTAHLARAAVAFEDASWRPGLSGDESIGLLRVALARGGEQDPLGSARILSALTRALIFTGALAESVTTYERAVQTARRAGDPRILVGALVSGLSARWEPARIDTRLDAAGEAIRIGRGIGDRGPALEATAWQLFDLMELGVDERFLQAYRDYEQLATDSRQPFHIYTSMSFRPALALMAGDLAASERHANELLQLGERQPGLDAAGVYATQIFTLRREQGELRQLAPIVQHFVSTTAESARWRPGLALVFAELGMLDEARREFEALATSAFAGVPRDAMWVASITYLAEVCVILDDTRRAQSLHEALLPFRDRNLLAGTSVACFGAASRVLGTLAATAGRMTDARALLEHAIAFNARQGATTWVAHSQFHYARVLKAGGRGTDRKRANGMLAEAMSTAQRHGLTALAARITALNE